MSSCILNRGNVLRQCEQDYALSDYFHKQMFCCKLCTRRVLLQNGSPRGFSAYNWSQMTSGRQNRRKATSLREPTNGFVGLTFEEKTCCKQSKETARYDLKSYASERPFRTKMIFCTWYIETACGSSCVS